MWNTDNPVLPSEIGRQLGMESTDATIEKVEAYCLLEVQKIELRNEPKILALKAEGALLVDEEADLRNKLQDAPSAGSLSNRRWLAIYYWAVTASLSAAGFFLLIYTFAPFNMGSFRVLYCLGAAIVVPFLFDLVLQSPARRKLFGALAITASIAGLSSLMLLALIRGDLLAQELQSSTPAVIFDDVQPAPAVPAPQTDFYQETMMMLRAALVLLAFAMDVGAGLALREAKQIGCNEGEDWGRLRAHLAEIQKRVISLVLEIRVLENEGQAFAKAFWADFYKAMLTHTLKGAMGKLLLSGIILFTLFHPYHTFASVRTQLVIAVDLTKSVAVKDAVGHTEFQKNIDAVSRLLSTLSASSKVTVIGITDHSFTQPYILLSATIPDDFGYFGERLKQARAELTRAWKIRTAHLAPRFNQTDIIGVLFLASELFQGSEGSTDKELIILSDMQNSTQELNLESDIDLGHPWTMTAKVPIARLSGIRIEVAGVDAARKSIGYWQRLRMFWIEYFYKTDANLQRYTTLPEIEKP